MIEPSFSGIQRVCREAWCLTAVQVCDFPPTVRSIFSNSAARLPISISVRTFNNTRPQQEAGGLFACVVYALSFPRLSAHTLEAE